jgi:hypothetical protein
MLRLGLLQVADAPRADKRKQRGPPGQTSLQPQHKGPGSLSLSVAGGAAAWCNNPIVTTILAFACRSLPNLKRATRVCRSWAALLTGPEAPGVGLWLRALGLAPDFSDSPAVAWQALSLLRAVEWFPATTFEPDDDEWEYNPIKIREVRCRGFRLRALPLMRVLAVHSCAGAEFDDWTDKDDFFQLLLPSTNPSTREFTGVSALVSLDIMDPQGSHTVQIGWAQLTAFRDCLTALDLPAARLTDAHLIGLLFHLALSSTYRRWKRRRKIRRPPVDHDCRCHPCKRCDYDPCPIGYILQAADEGLMVDFAPGEEEQLTIVIPANDPDGGAPMWDCFYEALNIVFPEGRWGQSEEEEEDEDDGEPEEYDEEGDWEEDEEEEYEEEEHDDDEEEGDDEDDEHEDGDEGEGNAGGDRGKEEGGGDDLERAISCSEEAQPAKQSSTACVEWLKTLRAIGHTILA